MAVNQTDGEVFSGADVKAVGAIKEIYTGTGLNISTTSSATGTYEFSAIPSADLGGSSYVQIEAVFYISKKYRNSSGGSSFNIQIETKEIGGVYSDFISDTLFSGISGVPGYAADGVIGIQEYTTLKFLHTLTAGEKTNGIQIKVSTSGTTAVPSEVLLTNVQTIISTGYA